MKCLEIKMWQTIKVAERSEDGGFKNITDTCSCGRQSLVLAYDETGKRICKSCVCEILNMINDKILDSCKIKQITDEIGSIQGSHIVGSESANTPGWNFDK